MVKLNILMRPVLRELTWLMYFGAQGVPSKRDLIPMPTVAQCSRELLGVQEERDFLRLPPEEATGISRARVISMEEGRL